MGEDSRESSLIVALRSWSMVISVDHCYLWQKIVIQLEHDETGLLLKIPNIKNFWTGIHTDQ